ncbi:hypothetical protein FOA43_002539 [Brettanomyces nanus]|uniref:Transcription initiation factor IIF subunit alpha n=1 Tax=Eeniella nana TaxID=13502 RepID=A0A875S624_EENNA|nr:uncharacterized protein FOA43_002539 [Brettanomyces nanus]QPG75189.1 hypothetical protein FOA43_002539 [Brettanomyces nanus]
MLSTPFEGNSLHWVKMSQNVQVKKEDNAKIEDAPQFDCFPLRACTKEDIEETRYHIMKFHSVKRVDPLKDFEQPTRLHRKDPKNFQFQMSMKELEQKTIDDRERDIERVEKRKEYMENKGIKPTELSQEQIDEKIELDGMSDEERAQRLDEKKREEDEIKRKQEKENQMKLVAPDGGARKTKRQVLKKKTRQIRAYDETKRRLRYEEFYPWVLEDYDAKQAWVGNYEAGNTDNYCLLVLDNANKCFKLVPLEKYYRFTPRNKYATLTLEEAEAKMNKGNTGQRWLMRKMAEEVANGQRVDLRYRKFKTTSRPHHEDTEDGKKTDDEDMDYDDEFQDDEEAPIMEGNEEENKLVEGKMKKNMLRANNLIEHSDEDESDIDDLFETRKVDKEGKKLRKALVQNAMNEVYDTDDEENNPYLSDSEIEKDDSDEDEDKIITIKKEAGADGKLEETVTVKKEGEEGLGGAKQIFVLKASDGVVTLRIPKTILSQFREGEWNPETAVRRNLKRKSPSPSPKAGESYEISKSDVDELIKDGPISLTTLVRSLKMKMSKDPNARTNLKKVLKESFVLKNKKVYKRL